MKNQSFKCHLYVHLCSMRCSYCNWNSSHWNIAHKICIDTRHTRMFQSFLFILFFSFFIRNFVTAEFPQTRLRNCSFHWKCKNTKRIECKMKMIGYVIRFCFVFLVHNNMHVIEMWKNKIINKTIEKPVSGGSTMRFSHKRANNFWILFKVLEIRRRLSRGR